MDRRNFCLVSTIWIMNLLDLVARSQGIPLELKFFESTVLIEVICGWLSRESFSLTVVNTLNPAGELFDLVAG